MITAFRMALRSISSNKLRSALTMLGIVIGVMTLVVLVSLVNSATDSVTSAVSSLGTDLLTVNVLDDKGQPISPQTLGQWMEEEPAIGLIAPYSVQTATAKFEGKNESISIYGTTPAYCEIEGLKVITPSVFGVVAAEPVSDVLGGCACFITMYFAVYRKLKTGEPLGLFRKKEKEDIR